jgi:lipoprotein-anchoring transpeptidase ErfK/SrfK
MMNTSRHQWDRWTGRVIDLPEVSGELTVCVDIDEIRSEYWPHSGYLGPLHACHHGCVVRRATRVVLASASLICVGLVCVGLAGRIASGSGRIGEGGRGYSVAAVAAPEYGARVPRKAAPLSPPTPARPPSATPFPFAGPTLIATLRTATPYRASPSPGAPAAGTLAATNPFGGAQVLAVLGSPTAAGLLHVELPTRPNGSQGWIPARGVALAETSYHVFVNLAARSVTVTDAGRPVVSAPAAVGKPATPTPTGQTYLWELIRPDDPQGAYGPYIFGLGWFSDAYAVFNGGDAQIGIHGQDEPSSLGQAVSHGCVRLPNDVITRLAGLLPLGTPVTIS